MRCNDLNINFNRQAFLPAFQGKFESLKSWGSRLFQRVQNHPYALHHHSPQVISGVLFTINGLFFLAMRSCANQFEASLNKKFPAIPTINLTISSAFLGGAVGALNLALFKHARLPVSVSILYAISIASVALHLILKPSISSVINKTPSPSQHIPTTISSQTNEAQTTLPEPKRTPAEPKPEHPHPRSEPTPPQAEPTPPNPPEPFQTPLPPAQHVGTGVLTPEPSKSRLNQSHTPQFSPRNPSIPPTPPVTVPQLNIKDVEEVEIRVLQEITQLQSKKEKIQALSMRYEVLIKKLNTELKSDGCDANRITTSIQESEAGQGEAIACIAHFDSELAEQRKLLESIRENKQRALPSETRSGPGTPEAKFRQQLVKAASSLSQRVQEPPALQTRVASLELNHSLNSPERKDTHIPPPLTLSEEPPFQPISTDFSDDQPPLDCSSSDDDEQIDEPNDHDDADYEFADEEGNVYQQVKFSNGNSYMVNEFNECFDLEGNYVGHLVKKALS